MKTILTVTTAFLLSSLAAVQSGAFSGNPRSIPLHNLTLTEDKKMTDKKNQEPLNFDCTVPARPGAISGSPVACFRVPATYSVSPVPGATSYSWTVVGGGIIGSKTGPTITVNWGWGAKSVSVRAVNNCGSSSSRSLTIIRVLDCTFP